LGVLPEDAHSVWVMLYTERKPVQMIQGAKHTVTTQTQTHTIKVIDGYLTIEGEQKMLTPDETEQLLDALLIWRYGLEAMPMDALEE
jgi:hypothetical protein